MLVAFPGHKRLEDLLLLAVLPAELHERRVVGRQVVERVDRNDRVFFEQLQDVDDLVEDRRELVDEDEVEGANERSDEHRLHLLVDVDFDAFRILSQSSDHLVRQEVDRLKVDDLVGHLARQERVDRKVAVFVDREDVATQRQELVQQPGQEPQPEV